jgi:MFS family permease
LNRPHTLLPLLTTLGVLTFLDRIAISVAAPRIQRELNITPTLWGWVVGSFVLAYGIFEMPTGALGDLLGPRKVITRIVLWWSGFTALTGAANAFLTLVVIRFLFGVGEAGAYPNISAVIARWLPVKERARAQGFVWAASRLGGALSPLVVVPMQARFGWRITFAMLGLVGILWTLWWRWGFREPASMPPNAGLQAAHSGIPWQTLFRSRHLWLIFAMYWCYSWGSWFYFGWFPTYLTRSAGFSEAEMAWMSALPFLAGTAGNLAGGYLSDRLVKRLGLKNGRRILGSVSLAASAILLVAMSQAQGKLAIAILAALGFGVADLMLPSAWAVCLDVGGAYAGAVSGFMNTAGQLGGFVCSVLYGYVVQATGSYNFPLAIVASMVLISAILFGRIDASQPLLEAATVLSTEARLA